MGGKKSTFDRPFQLEFTSDRKRMSVIIFDPNSNTWKIYTKGADEVIFPRLKHSKKKILFQKKKNFISKKKIF